MIDMVNYIMFSLLFFAAFLAGITVGRWSITRNRSGTVVINTKDPDKDVISFQLRIPISEMMQRKSLYFTVDTDVEEK